MRYILLRPECLPVPGAPPYAGGVHLFQCMARAIAGDGHAVHLLTTAPRAAVLAAAAQAGALAALQQHTPGLVSWQQLPGGVHTHVALTDEPDSGHEQRGATAAPAGSHASEQQQQQQQQLPPPLQRLLDQAVRLASAPPAASDGAETSDSSSPSAACAVVLDADASLRAACCGTASLLEAAVAALGRGRVLLLAQNPHFLPAFCGPLSTVAPTGPALEAAWRGLAGLVAVSQFLGNYLQQGGGSRAPGSAGGGGSDGGWPPVTVALPSAWGVFGRPPFADLGAAVAARLPCSCCGGSVAGCDACATAAVAAAASAACEPGDAPPSNGRPVVGMLKLAPEKGEGLFIAMAQQLPHLDFLAVAAAPHSCGGTGADAAAAEAGATAAVAAAPAAAPPLPPNLELAAPVADVGQVLSRVWLLVAPSLWAEAFGMVVVDAMLRGIPMLVSDRGGLPEAALGAGTVLPVAPMVLPRDPRTGCPSWAGRRHPPASQQLVSAWVAEVQRLLGSRQAYADASSSARAAALAFVEGGPAERARCLAWVAEALEAGRDGSQPCNNVT